MAKAAPAARLVTAEELLAVPDDGQRRELVRGEVVTMAPAGMRHGAWGDRLGWRLAQHVYEHGLGLTFSAETGFVLSRGPDTVRCADASFVAAGRLDDADAAGFVPLAPDLVLEVVSPSDRQSQVTAKVMEWLDAGVTVVWVLWPESRRLQVWRSADDIVTLGADDTLTCEDLLPGFAVALAKVMA